MIQDKIRGSLIGGAVGDALGYAVEFDYWRQIQLEYGPDGITQYCCDKKTGKAMVSDDTQMTLFTANGILVGTQLIREKGLETEQHEAKAMLLQMIYRGYLDWFATQYMKKSKKPISWLLEIPELYQRQAPGGTCLSSLRSGGMGSVEEPINHSKGCGGVMRVAPIGLFYNNPEQIEYLNSIGAEAAAITHGHPLGYIPAAALVHIVNRIVFGGCKIGNDLYAIVAECRETLIKMFGDEPYLKRMLNLMDLAVKLSQNKRADYKNIKEIGEGWVGEEALAIALYCCLRYQDNFDGVMISAVNHDGDSDSTGAIAGNIIGAYIGYEAISQKWKTDLEMQDVLLEIADDLYLESCTETKRSQKKYQLNEDGVLV